MTRAAASRHGVRDWVDSTFYDAGAQPEKSYEKTRIVHRDADDLLAGCSVRELDIELDTIPAELLDLIKP